MSEDANEYMPYPWAGRETYGSYCQRLEEMLIKITALESPSASAIQALAFIAMDAPSDFDYTTIREVPPSRRMREFLSKQPDALRALFRTTALELPNGVGHRKRRRVEVLLGL